MTSSHTWHFRIDCPLHSTKFAPLLGALALMAALLCAPPAEAIDDPALEYYTITTPNFYVHYYDGLEDLALRSAKIAEESHTVLSPLLDWEPAVKTHLLVADKLDTANGFARVFGRNFITIYGKPPTPDGALGYYDDWLRVLIYHEYVHILHLDTNPGIPQWINRVIGKQYHPNAALPRWYVEGIAVYLETVRTGRGRANSPVYKMWLRTAALDDELFSLGQATGLPFKWPRGSGPYLYGTFFIDYMARTEGENFIRDFNHRYGTRPIPFAINKITDDLTDSTIAEHWEGFVAESRAEAQALRVAVEAAGRTELDILTDGGGRNRYPIARPDPDGERRGVGAITYHRAGLSDPPVFASLSRSGAGADPIYDGHGAAGPSAWSPDGETFYFSRAETAQNVYNYQDLYAYTPKTDRLRRLTQSDRAREPTIHPDGTEMIHVRNRAGSMELVRRNVERPATAEVLLGRNDWPAEDDGHWQQISQPVYTPDGDGVVFSWWRLDRRQRDLYLLDLNTGMLEALTDSPAHDIDPHFGPDGYLYFSSNVDDVFNIHAIDMETGQIWQVSNVLRGVFAPHVSPDRRWIYVYTYTAEGFEIARFRHPGRFYHADRRATERTSPWLDYPTPDPDDISEPEPYRAAPWMRPIFFMPDFGVLSSGAGLGANVSSYDPVEHHEYTLAGGWTTGPEFTDYGANLGLGYSYNGAPLNISTRARFRDLPRTNRLIAGSQYIPFVERQYLAGLRVSYPLRFHRQRFSVSTSYQVEYTTDRNRGTFEPDPADINPSEPRLGFFNELSFGLRYSNTSRYPYSISTERGVSASTSLSLHHPSLGHPDNAVTFGYGFDLYQPNPLLDRHVFAFRTRGAINRSATGAQRRYAIGGQSPQDVLSSVIFQEPRRGFPLRGFEPGLLQGTQYQVSKLEYRFPIVEFDHGFATLPVFFRNLKGSVFVDTGTAYDGYLFNAPFHTGIGTEVQLDTVLGYYESNSLRLGYARGLGEEGISDWYLLFGRGF